MQAKVLPGKVLTGDYVGGGRYTENQTVEIDDAVAPFYVDAGIIEEAAADPAPPVAEEA